MKYLFTSAIVFIAINLSYAQDRVFTSTYQTNVMEKGGFDLEYITVFRTGKVGAYSPFSFGRRLDSRLELEFGLGKNIQTAFYLNTSNFKYALLNNNAMEMPTQTSIETSFSNEWKIKLSDPVANRMGSAIYMEATVGSDEYSLEGKLILDKRINNEFIAFNLVGEYELETEAEYDGGKAERKINIETPIELNFAYMHFFNPRFGFGLESKNHNKITDNGWEYSVLFAGPVVFYSQESFFLVLNVLPQISNLYKTSYAPGSRVLDDHEGFEFHLLIGHSF